ncbi:MAG TPA: DUF2292 domain-containing protein [Verrucomicrobiae bacterium]|nr:DUF2292 domain-containing protein [Verrucomicrobiae bacterium]
MIQHVGSLLYGVVDIIVHDSRVMQIEKTSACGWKNHG